MKNINIYEPSMCCPTGLCGVTYEPELVRISAIFDKLVKNDVKAERFNLSNSPMEFIKNREVNKIVGDQGVEALPITVVEGEIVLMGRYPSNDEIVKLLDLPQELLYE